MKCENYQYQIEDYANCLLQAVDAENIATHISHCSECKGFYEYLLKEQATFAPYLVNIKVSTGLRAGLEAQIKREKTATSAKSLVVFSSRLLVPFQNLGFNGVYAALAAILLISVVSAALFMRSGSVVNLLDTENTKINNADNKAKIAPELTHNTESDKSVEHRGGNGDRMISHNAGITNVAEAETSRSEISLRLHTPVRTEKAPPNFASTSAYKKTNGIDGKSKKLSERNVFVSESKKVPKPNRTRRLFKQIPKIESEEAIEFYQLTFAGNLKSSEEELQVVRVELPRSSLIALGLKLPIENEEAQIKTDLLVSSDGITRAIRLVK